MLYLTFKTLHIFCVMLWITGMITQTLIITVSQLLPGAPQLHNLAKLRLLYKWNRVLTAPAMIIALGTGVFIATEAGWFGSGWLFAKIAFVLFLIVLHGIQTGKLRRMILTEIQNVNFNGDRTLFLILCATFFIIFFVVFRPF